MLWIVALILVLCLLLYILFLPIDILIDTSKNEYCVKLGVLARAMIEGDDNYLFRIQVRTFFVRFFFYPLKKRPRKKKEKKSVKKKVRMKWSYLGTAVRLLKSFEVKRFGMDLDTGNCITNAKLYPLFAFFNYRGGNFNINFRNENRLDLHIQNRPIRIIKSFINPKKLYHGITL